MPPQTQNSVITDQNAKIRFQFSTRSRVHGRISVDEYSPLIETLDNPMTAKTDIVLDSEHGTAILTPMGYVVTMPIRRIDEETLDDKYQTALMFLDNIITDEHRNFSPSIVLTGNNPAQIYNQHRDTLNAWGEDTFGVEGQKKVLGSNEYITLAFRGGPPVQV